ncbi:Arsenate reductase and related proteins, glutaredoxin family [Raoultella terrigena]|uniref:Arsenate reductase and related proteins, glutaredoxin family n=1 Tax=Raoultella terrigena TaxID=577 RepID=A0A3P8JVP1_RAOTE|nr:Arsenate reductase and related proteins, glutaredoxin family [Raoultella terrigena]
MHVWTADTRPLKAACSGVKTLDDMAALHPQQVIPGHYLGTPPPAGDRAIVFTRDYLQQFEQALQNHKDSAGVIKEMKPALAEAWRKRARWS